MTHPRSVLPLRLFLSIAILIPTAGCGRRSSTPEHQDADSLELSPALIGKQLTVHGTFSLNGKFGPYISVGNRQVVYLVPKGPFTWGEPYSQMEGKLVEATGTLGFFHSPPSRPTSPAIAQAPDYFYFNAETMQLRLVRQ